MLQGFGHSDLSFYEGAVRYGVAASDRCIESLLRLTGLNWSVPDFSRLPGTGSQ
jgi:hypothetical protein